MEKGFAHKHSQCTVAGEEFIVNTIDCGPDFSVVASPRFNNVAVPIDFGWQANANSWHKVTDYLDSTSSGLTDFYINRYDVPGVVPAANLAPERDAIIGSNTTYNSSFDALITPMSRAFDYPPVVLLNQSMNGSVAAIDVQAFDDGQVTTIEIVVDWTVIATCSNANSCSASYDFAQHPRNYAYVYARAYDDTQFQDKSYNQVAYTKVVEIGPEIINASAAPSAPTNVAPIVSAGADQSVTMPSAATLNGTVTDDGNPGGAVSTTWSMVSGSGTATFGNSGAEDTTVSFSAAGAYVLRLTANDGALSSNDDVTISVNPAQLPATPTVATGSAQVSVGGTAPVQIVLSSAPGGVSGYTLRLAVADGTLARIDSIQLGAGFVSLDPSQDNLSDTLVLFSAVDANDLIGSGGTNIVLATVNVEALGEGPTFLTITVIALDDDAGQPVGAGTTSGSFTGLNVAPTVAASPKTVGASTGAAFSGLATITDAGDQQWDVTVDYGDGSSPVSLPASGASIVLGHAYSLPGSYTVTVTAIDDDGAAASDTITVNVVSGCPTLPGLPAPAGDLDGDGLCEDINGNGRLDFDDVAEFFEHLNSVEVQSNISKFDFNGTGTVDMDDIVHLFGKLLS